MKAFLYFTLLSISMMTAAIEAGIESVRVSQPYIAITFDDGPHEQCTPAILDILKERNVKATFFVQGDQVKARPEILKRTVAEGHEIGNHSWNHPEIFRLSKKDLHYQLAETTKIIEETTGKKVAIMRPPYGRSNEKINRYINKNYGLKVIQWSVDPNDWADNTKPEVITHRVLKYVRPGAIILLHDRFTQTVKALPATLDGLLERGYEFVTVSELLALER